MLVELRRELDEVARRAAEARIFDRREHRVQRVSEFVKHRRDVAEAEERRLTGGRLCEVLDVVHNRLAAEEFALTDEAAGPGAAALVRPRERIEIEQRESSAVRIDDIEYADVRLIDRNVFALLERHSVEFVRGEENAIAQHAIDLKVWPHL